MGDKYDWTVDIAGTVSLDLDDVKDFPGLDASIVPTVTASMAVSAGGDVEMTTPVTVNLIFALTHGDKDDPTLSLAGEANFTLPCETSFVVEAAFTVKTPSGLLVGPAEGTLVKYCKAEVRRCRLTSG